jgi:hypothetical protein
MLGAARWGLVPTLIAGWLLLPSTALALTPQVYDHGKFFDAKTIEKANDLLKRIEKVHKKDVVVITYDKIPDDVLARIKYDPKNRKSFFHQWAQHEAKAGEVNGIVILIAKDQNHNGTTWVEEDVGENTRDKEFKEADRDDLHNIFTNKWKEDHNAALLDGLQFIDGRMTFHQRQRGSQPGAVTPPTTTTTTAAHHDNAGWNIFGLVCIGLCVLLGIWLIVGLIRAFSGGGYAGGGPGYAGGYGGGYGGGGGGFFPGLLGGLFGGMAGMWLYNNMFGGGGFHQGGWESSAHAGQSTGGGTDDVRPSDEGQGFSGGGGDVDGGSGGDVDGGDAGGGGGGGGDWGGGGGGDWGGGGDAGGGGGGDWGGGGDAGGGGGDWGGGGGGDFGGGGGGGDW